MQAYNGSELALTVGSTPTPEQVRQMLQENVAAVKRSPGIEFPQPRNQAANNSVLEHVPFMIVSGWMERKVDAQVFQSGRAYPEHQVVQMWIRTINPSTFELYDAEMATLSGAYLLNQFRNATHNELQNGGPWTLRRHPHLSMAKYGKPDLHPLMLALYDPDKDVVVDPDEFQMEEPESPVVANLSKPAHGFTTPMDPVPAFDMARELVARGITMDEFLEYTGWPYMRGHSEAQIRTAFVLIDRQMALASVKNGETVDSGVRRVGRPRKTQ